MDIYNKMGLREKVAIVVAAVILIGIACTLCMPRNQKSQLKQYIKNFKRSRFNKGFLPTSTTIRIKPPLTPKFEFQEIQQSDPIYNTPNSFPNVDYPIMSNVFKTDGYDFIENNEQNNAIELSRDITDIRKAAKFQRQNANKARRTSNDEISSSTKKEVNEYDNDYIKIASFPEVEYPQSISDTWIPNFVNYKPYTDFSRTTHDFSQAETLVQKNNLSKKADGNIDPIFLNVAKANKCPYKNPSFKLKDKIISIMQEYANKHSENKTARNKTAIELPLPIQISRDDHCTLQNYTNNNCTNSVLNSSLAYSKFESSSQAPTDLGDEILSTSPSPGDNSIALTTLESSFLKTMPILKELGSDVNNPEIIDFTTVKPPKVNIGTTATTFTRPKLCIKNQNVTTPDPHLSSSVADSTNVLSSDSLIPKATFSDSNNCNANYYSTYDSSSSLFTVRDPSILTTTESSLVTITRTFEQESGSNGAQIITDAIASSHTLNNKESYPYFTTLPNSPLSLKTSLPFTKKPEPASPNFCSENTATTSVSDLLSTALSSEVSTPLPEYVPISPVFFSSSTFDEEGFKSSSSSLPNQSDFTPFTNTNGITAPSENTLSAIDFKTLTTLAPQILLTTQINSEKESDVRGVNYLDNSFSLATIQYPDLVTFLTTGSENTFKSWPNSEMRTTTLAMTSLEPFEHGTRESKNCTDSADSFSYITTILFPKAVTEIMTTDHPSDFFESKTDPGEETTSIAQSPIMLNNTELSSNGGLLMQPTTAEPQLPITILTENRSASLESVTDSEEPLLIATDPNSETLTTVMQPLVTFQKLNEFFSTPSDEISSTSPSLSLSTHYPVEYFTTFNHANSHAITDSSSETLNPKFSTIAPIHSISPMNSEHRSYEGDAAFSGSTVYLMVATQSTELVNNSTTITPASESVQSRNNQGNHEKIPELFKLFPSSTKTPTYITTSTDLEKTDVKPIFSSTLFPEANTETLTDLKTTSRMSGFNPKTPSLSLDTTTESPFTFVTDPTGSLVTFTRSSYAHQNQTALLLCPSDEVSHTSSSSILNTRPVSINYEIKPTENIVPEVDGKTLITSAPTASATPIHSEPEPYEFGSSFPEGFSTSYESALTLKELENSLDLILLPTTEPSFYIITYSDKPISNNSSKEPAVGSEFHTTPGLALSKTTTSLLRQGLNKNFVTMASAEMNDQIMYSPETNTNLDATGDVNFPFTTESPLTFTYIPFEQEFQEIGDISTVNPSNFIPEITVSTIGSLSVSDIKTMTFTKNDLPSTFSIPFEQETEERCGATFLKITTIEPLTSITDLYTISNSGLNFDNTDHKGDVVSPPQSQPLDPTTNHYIDSINSLEAETFNQNADDVMYITSTTLSINNPSSKKNISVQYSTPTPFSSTIPTSAVVTESTVVITSNSDKINKNSIDSFDTHILNTNTISETVTSVPFSTPITQEPLLSAKQETLVPAHSTTVDAIILSSQDEDLLMSTPILSKQEYNGASTRTESKESFSTTVSPLVIITDQTSSATSTYPTFTTRATTLLDEINFFTGISSTSSHQSLNTQPQEMRTNPSSKVNDSETNEKEIMTSGPTILGTSRLPSDLKSNNSGTTIAKFDPVTDTSHISINLTPGMSDSDSGIYSPEAIALSPNQVTTPENLYTSTEPPDSFNPTTDTQNFITKSKIEEDIMMSTDPYLRETTPAVAQSLKSSGLRIINEPLEYITQSTPCLLEDTANTNNPYTNSIATNTIDLLPNDNNADVNPNPATKENVQDLNEIDDDLTHMLKDTVKSMIEHYLVDVLYDFLGYDDNEDSTPPDISINQGPGTPKEILSKNSIQSADTHKIIKTVNGDTESEPLPTAAPLKMTYIVPSESTGATNTIKGVTLPLVKVHDLPEFSSTSNVTSIKEKLLKAVDVICMKFTFN